VVCRRFERAAGASLIHMCDTPKCSNATHTQRAGSSVVDLGAFMRSMDAAVSHMGHLCDALVSHAPFQKYHVTEMFDGAETGDILCAQRTGGKSAWFNPRTMQVLSSPPVHARLRPLHGSGVRQFGTIQLGSAATPVTSEFGGFSSLSVTPNVAVMLSDTEAGLLDPAKRVTLAAGVPYIPTRDPDEPWIAPFFVKPVAGGAGTLTIMFTT
jgi:hypothetical protein